MVVKKLTKLGLTYQDAEFYSVAVMDECEDSLSSTAVALLCGLLPRLPPHSYRQLSFHRGQSTRSTSDPCRCFSLEARDSQALFYLAPSLRALGNYRQRPEFPLPRVHRIGFSSPSFLNPLCISIHNHRDFSVYLSSFPTGQEVLEDGNCFISAHRTQSLEQPVV